MTKTEQIQDKKIPLTRIQKLIGKLMLKSKQLQPSSYLECKADLTELLKIRKPYCKQTGIRVTTNDFFFCAISRAIKKFPLMAAQLDRNEDHLIISDQIGVGFAVAAPQGLVVPVIKNCANKNLPQIASESDILLKKARANKLTPEDFEGDNIVLSSLGMYGVSTFFAISPPGATGIISVGRIEDDISCVNGEFTTIKTMSVALAANLRIVDDFYAAKFLRCVVDQLENPQSLTSES
ncbi:MAG: 2-oxo acid dehydrogenase subunit E2 [Sedimentisphaerales bacterium]|nr:2-oxo acid dehydrogenase subunit E2 [Sedimentisphaerales bacterium]